MNDTRVSSDHGTTSDAPSPPSGPIDDEVRALMWNAVGLIRDAATLAPAVEQLATWSGRSSLATLGYLIARAALRRQESRGGHFRADFPSRDDLHWRIHVVERKHG